MSAANRNSKESKQHAVAVAILEIIEKDGLLGVTHSKVSRKSGVSRAWIYEYIGKQKESLIESAADAIAADLTRAQMTVFPKTRAELERQVAEGTDFLFESTEINPVAIRLYYRFRGTLNPIGRVIQKYEKRWMKDASRTLTEVLEMSPDHAELLSEFMLTLRLGFSHRIATSAKSSGSKESARKIFGFTHALLSGTL